MCYKSCVNKYGVTHLQKYYKYKKLINLEKVLRFTFMFQILKTLFFYTILNGFTLLYTDDNQVPFRNSIISKYLVSLGFY